MAEIGPRTEAEPPGRTTIARYGLTPPVADVLLQGILEVAAAAVGCSMAGLVLVAGGDHRHILSHGYAVDPDDLRAFTLPMDLVAGHAAAIPDLRADPDAAFAPACLHYGARFIGAAPLIASDGRMIGALMVADREPRRGVSGVQSTLTVLASHAMLGLERRAEDLERAERERERERLWAARLSALGEAIGGQVGLLAAGGLVAGGAAADAADGVTAHAARVVETGEPSAAEVTETASGVDRVLLRRYAPVPGIDGRVSEVAVAVRDVTEERKAAREASVLSRAADFSSNAILVTDADANIVYVNRAFLVMSGYSAEEVIGRNPRMFQSGKTPQSTYGALWSHIAGGFTWRGEMCNRRKNGEQFWEVLSVAPVRDEAGSIAFYVAVIEDQTDGRLREAERSALAGLLRVAHAHANSTDRDFLRAVVRFVREWSGFDAVGIRLREGDSYPYVVTIGFPASVGLRSPARLAGCGWDGDPSGTSVCLCDAVIRGASGGSAPGFTERGSYWVAPQPASARDACRPAPVRCTGCGGGYASVVLVPIRYGDRTLGLLHFLAREPDRADEPAVHLYERLADHLSLALVQREAEREVRSSNTLYRSIARNYPDGAVMVFDKDLHCEVAEGRALIAFGISSGASGDGFAGDREAVAAFPWLTEMCRAALDGLNARAEETYDGRQYAIVAAPIMGGDGTVDRCLVVAHDVTSLKEAEERSLRREAEFRRLAESLPDAVVRVGADERLQYANQVFATTLNLPVTQIVGLRGEDLGVPPEVLELWARHTRRVISAGVSATFEFAFQTGGASLQVEARIVPEYSASGEVVSVLAICRDVSAQNRAIRLVERSRQELAVLSTKLVEVQEDERGHIARELHDGIGQSLTSIKLVLEMAQALEGPAGRQALDRAVGQVQDVMREVREISQGLRPPVLDDLGLVPALEWLVRRIRQVGCGDIRLDHSGLDRRLVAPLETGVFRIVQEALTNVVRHARATVVTVRVHLSGDELSISVADNGVGFSPSEKDPTLSAGISGMRQRAQLLGGRLVVESGAGLGTWVSATVPVSDDTRQEEPPC